MPTLHTSKSLKFGLWKLRQFAAALVAPTLREHFRHWRPLEQPTHGRALVAAWRESLGCGAAGSSAAADDVYGALVYLCVLPALRGCLSNEWRPRESDEAIALLAEWLPLLPRAVWLEVVDSCVLPRLTAELSSWQPASDATPPHHWLHPWLPLLPPPGITDLFPSLRHKLAKALEARGATDAAARAIVLPWATVLDANSWRALLVRYVLPKLAVTLREELTINPAAQDLEPLHAVFAWRVALSVEQLAELLLADFFPKWLTVLRAWLAQRPDFDEVSRWYVGWKACLLEHGGAPLLAHGPLRAQLNAALALVNTALTAAELRARSQQEPARDGARTR